MRFIFLSLLFCCAYVHVGYAQEISVRLSKLTQLLKTYEAGFAYLKQCDNYEAKTKESPFYMANAQVIVVAIGEELLKMRPDKTPEDMTEYFLKKRETISAWANEKVDEGGCEGEFSQAAKEHFNTFKNVSPNGVMEFISKL